MTKPETRGRTPRTPVEALADSLNTTALAQANDASHQMSVADQIAIDQAELYKVVGRIESAHFIETVSSRLIGEAYLSARALIGKVGEITVKAADGNLKRVSSLEDFCESVMPVSYRRCHQIAQAMHTLGPALYEQAEQLGLGHRNYAAIRALPGDMQAEVKAAITSGDRDQVLTLIEELASRNGSLSANVAEQAKVLAAKDAVIAKKDQKINRLAEQIEMRRGQLGSEQESAQLDALRSEFLATEQALLGLLATVDEVMNAAATPTAGTAARQTLDLLVQRLVDGCLKRGITVDLADRVSPIYMRDIDAIANAAPATKRQSKKQA